MAQKTKVKELVGRGLHSYHTKALQQIHRIEKKNKEQNHKISILSNELDNDYLTKTEEGSVVSLEHSKEGMVYLDELQGNTLVNYCTDGSKEMTLNGDIDVEGTFVTTTEGVDNGKVDVYCEGNTLVNLRTKNNCGMAISDTSVYTETYKSNVRVAGTVASKPTWTYLNMGTLNMSRFKPSTTYTVIFNKTMNVTQVCLQMGNINQVYSNNVKIQNNKAVLTTVSNLNEFSFTGSDYIYCYLNTSSFPLSFDCEIVGILEGDWTNKEVPSEYFEGMKSIGQDDENGHKIEILSQNKNLLKWNRNTVSTGSFNTKGFTYSVDANNTITVSGTTTDTQADLYLAGGWGYSKVIQTLDVGTYTASLSNLEKDVTLYLINKNSVIASTGYNGKDTFTITKPIDITGIFIRMKPNVEFTNKIVEPQLEKGNVATSYIQPKQNKKEILINEPLRKLPNGVCDKVVKINNKYFIERNCGEFILTETTKNTTHNAGVANQNNTMVFAIDRTSNNINYKQMVKSGVCDKFNNNSDVALDEEMIYFGQNMNIRINKNKLTTPNTEGFIEWLRNNPVRIIHQLEKVIYEEIVNTTLNTYNDITHISNNSIIPCNMKIQNSGYNAIIKPSTLYTIALDTNKNGTIGLNLGGAKVTTTNNVATITTPATLTDDSLRLYGKGIKGSKVRLLEGDKTNWIPSHFEGMKSSFEDKLQEDGSYKMEILSNNENLINLDKLKTRNYNDHRVEKLPNGFKIISGVENLWGIVAEFELRVKPNTNYTFGITKTTIKDAYEGNHTSWDVGYTWIKTENDRTMKEFKLKNNGRTTVTFNSHNNTMIRIRFTTATDVPLTTGEYDFTDISLLESDSNETHINQKYNKIQFSFIEPLRSVEVSKDRFVFKDGKLMIERNIGAKRLESKYVTGYGRTNNTNSQTKPNVRIIHFNLPNLKPSWGGLTTLCDKLKTGRIGNGHQTSIEHLYWGTEYDWIGCNNTDRPSVGMSIDKTKLSSDNIEGAKQYIDNENIELVYQLAEPTYEEIPFELQKIILEGYENGTLFFDTNIPPTSTVTYAGETPIVKSVRLNKTEVLNNTEDINDNIIPYLMDMDYRVVMLQLATEELEGGVSMARLFGGTYEMIKRDILSKRLTREEYGYRLADYFNAGKLTEEQVRELEDLR